jgi:hypothetical protein
MWKNVVATVVILGIALFIAVRFSSHDGVLKTAWVSLEPTQCHSNPWEGGNALPEGVSEIEAIKTFYGGQGIIIYDVQTKPTHEIVCMSCACPRGDTLYISVAVSDVQRMLSQGFSNTEGPSLQ